MKKVSKILSVVLALCLMMQMTAISVFAEEGDATSTPVDTQIIAPLTSFDGASTWGNGTILGRPTDATSGGFKAFTNYMTRAEVDGVFGKASGDKALKTTTIATTVKLPIDAIEGVANYKMSDGDYILFSTQFAFDNDVSSIYLGLAAKNDSNQNISATDLPDKGMSLSRFGTAGDSNINDGKGGGSVVLNQPLSVYLEAGKWYDFDVLFNRVSASASTVKIYLDNVLIGEKSIPQGIYYISQFQFGPRYSINDITDASSITVAGIETYLDNISMTQYSGYTEVPAAVAALDATVLSAKSETNLKQQYNTFYTIGDMTVSDVLSAINVPAGVTAVYTDANYNEIADTSSAAANGYIKATDAAGNVTYYSMLTDLVLAYDDFSDSRFAPRLSKYIHKWTKSPGTTGGNYETEYVGGIGGKDADDYALKYFSNQANNAKYVFNQANIGYGWDAYDTMPLVSEVDVMFTGDNDSIEFYSKEAKIFTTLRTSDLKKNEWHRVTVAYFGTKRHLWIDGKYHSESGNSSSKSSTFEITIGVHGAAEAVSTAIYLDNVKMYYADSADFFTDGAAKETIENYITAESSSANITISDSSVLLKNQMAYSDFIGAITKSSNVVDAKIYADNTYASVVTDGKIADGQVLVLTTESGAKEYYTIAVEKTEGTITFTESTDEDSNPTLTATANVTTNRAEDSYAFLLAEYNGNQLVKVYDIKTGTVTSAGAASPSITITNWDTTHRYKAFILDSITNIAPLGGSVSYNEQQ